MPQKFSSDLRVYWSDADSAGIVYFSHYFRFVEQVEQDFFRSFRVGRQELKESLGIWLPRVEAHCRWFKPARVDDLLTITLCIREMREKSLTFEFEVFRKGEPELLSQASYTVVCVDAQTFKARSIPQQIRDLLAPYVAEKVSA